METLIKSLKNKNFEVYPNEFGGLVIYPIHENCKFQKKEIRFLFKFFQKNKLEILSISNESGFYTKPL